MIVDKWLKNEVLEIRSFRRYRNKLLYDCQLELYLIKYFMIRVLENKDLLFKIRIKELKNKVKY